MSVTHKTPPDEVLQAVKHPYTRGQTVDALRLAEQFAPLSEWAGVEACIIAARIAENTGAPRLASRLTIRAWRTNKRDPAAQLQLGFSFISHRGPLALWLAMRGWPKLQAPAPNEEAEYLALQGFSMASLRDFSLAEQLLTRAEALDTKQAWVHLQRAHLLEYQDRIEEALETAQMAGALHPHPFYRPAVQVRARLLQLLDRDEDAIQLLHQAGASLQSGPVAVQLYSILVENGSWSEAATALQRYFDLSPLLEPGLKKWVTSQRARVAYHLGQRAEAAEFANSLEDEFNKRFAQKLGTAPEPSERVRLDVTFVRQHFKTCAPATLAALGRFWKMPGDHLKLAEAMCYDGTPHWQQRQWAENNGWFVREFRVTFGAAIALIKAGVPFAISTVEATAAHMQAVVGFDTTRATLLLRDPGQPHVIEADAESFLKRYRPFGPHGMVFLPMAERARVDSLPLEDTEIDDEHHLFALAIAQHDRTKAAEILSRMENRFDDHPVVWETRLGLATYDANSREQLKCLDKLLEKFPNNPARLLRRFHCMHEAPAPDRIEFLQRACASEGADPALFVELARLLLPDARRRMEAQHWLRRAFRLRPMDQGAITVRADLWWQDGKLEEATELYRFAAGLEAYREYLYQSWFAACRRTRRTTEAMLHLQDRFKRFGAKSGQPALTLAWAWREMDQPHQAREVLTEAIRLRPDDGALLLGAAVLVARLGEKEKAAQFLDSAKGKARESDWLRAASEIAEIQWDFVGALEHASAILKLESLALDARACAARSIARLQGPAAAMAQLQETCAQFPHHCGLLRMLVEWSRKVGPAEVEPAARELLRIDPAEPWTRRELAVALSRLGRNEEALSEAAEAAQIEPRNTFSFSTLGYIHRQLGHRFDAHAQYRRAVELSADNSHAIHSLIELAGTDKERRDELLFVEKELTRQVVEGDGLLTFLQLARPLIEPEKLLQSLRQAHSERPDLWHAWSALVSQLGHLGKLDEALDIAQQAAKKFPHLSRTWLDLSNARQWRNELDEEIKAAERAFEGSPSWSKAALALAGALERRGSFDDARGIYERALKHSDGDVQLRAAYAHLLWRQGKKEEAFTTLENSLRLSPGNDWAWNLLGEWAEACGEADRAVHFARTLAGELPGEISVWLTLARRLSDPSQMAEGLAAVEKALQLDPHCADAWDLKAALLTNEERFDEAIQTCTDGAAACPSDAVTLQGRRAWIESQRGNLPEAIRLMRLVLAENVNYVWGWNQVAHWLIEQGANIDAAAVLEQLLRLRPRDPWVHQQLGLLKLKSDDRPGARKAFATVLQINPTDATAARQLLDLQLNAGDLTAAESTLRLMQRHRPGAPTMASEILLRLRTGEIKEAGEAFEKLCLSQDPDHGPIDTATAAFDRGGQWSRCMKILKGALVSPSCNPQAGVAAINLLLKHKRQFSAVRLFLRFKPGEIQRRAAAPLVQGVAKSKSRLCFRWLLHQRREVFLRDTEAWGYVGYGFITLNKMKDAAAWLADWNTREHIQPWMLFNRCLALRHLGRYPEANELAQQVLEKWGHREGSADMRLFLAVEAALAGQIPEALDQLQQAFVRKNVAHDQQLHALAKALVEFQQSPSASRPARFKAVREELKLQFPGLKLSRSMKDIRRTFRRAGKVFVREGAGNSARLWFLWKIYAQWLMVPPVLAACLAAGLAPGVLPLALFVILFLRFARWKKLV